MGVFTLIIFIILMISLVKGKPKGDVVGVTFLALGVLATVIFGLIITENKNKKETDMSVTRADGFTIKKYDVTLEVNKNNSVNVTELITINFYESGHHGIYRFVPSWLEYTNKDGETQSRRASITGLKAIGEKYSTDIVKGKKRIKIGNANYTLPTGDHTYEIKYKYNMGKDPYEGYDEFIFHAFGDYWGTEIKNASITIVLPEAIDNKNAVHFFADKYRTSNLNLFMDYSVDGNVIKANLSPDYSLFNSLTVDIDLPEGYFATSISSYGFKSLLCCIICLATAIASFILWLKHGKDLPKEPETVEFYPPDNLDAAEVGYLYKKQTGKKLSIALIVELASKGIIKITESEDKKKTTISKSSYVSVDEYIKRQIKVVKLKDYKNHFLETRVKESNWMNDHFKDGSTKCIITSDFDQFYKDTDYLFKKGYIGVESDSIDDYTPEQITSIRSELDKNASKEKPKMSSREELVYDYLFETGNETELATNTAFYQVFSLVDSNLVDAYSEKLYNNLSYDYKSLTGFGYFICVLLWGISYCYIKDLDSSLSFLYTVALISNFVTAFFTIIMGKKSSYGEKMLARIKGFKNYIELAEKDQIEAQAEKNPNYFYDILPYAYVLGISKKWIEKFENIPVPAQDMGNFDYTDIGSIDSLSNSVYYPSSSSGGGGCSSCGGGCSSCGGGCSSCGGGGSW